ncbi:single-stranded DNA-binding protein [Labrys neptuniae]|uniref:single-stranded DNA-binding protein n=1 Tax=Labrys neptuniae TaxID=376174 RepID=UPI00288D2F2C|nr:single-stranded DNA-binding protein [Labrys neptuniae]MDT3377419.1 single-stranded DNA-binding protein [Labrys neptuniae]
MLNAHVLVQGSLSRAPERRTSRENKPFVIAGLREGQGDDVRWWNIVAFGDPADELASLKAGDGVAIAGSLKVETYQKDGETRVNLSVTVGRLISAHRQKRRDGQPQGQERQERRPDRLPPTTGRPYIDDELPF